MKRTIRHLAIAVLGIAVPTAAFGQCDVFRASGNPGDLTGESVAVHNDWMVYTENRAARVLRWSGASWFHFTDFTFTHRVHAVDVYDDVIVVGESANARIYIFRFDGANWNMEQSIDQRWFQSTDGGRTLDLHGDVLATCRASGPGAWVYRYIGGQWIQEFEDPFAWKSLATDGARLVLGNIDFFVHRYDGSEWIEDGSGDGAYGSKRVDISGELIVTGTPEDEDFPFQTGSVEVFRYCHPDLSVWCDDSSFVYTDDAAVWESAISVASSNQVVLYQDNGETFDGVDVFSATNADLEDAYFIEMDDTTIVVGAPYNDANGNSSGAIYAFRRDATHVAPIANGFEFGTCLFPYDTIQGGLAALTSSRVLVVAGGTYAEAPLVLDTPLSIHAAGGALVRVE